MCVCVCVLACSAGVFFKARDRKFPAILECVCVFLPFCSPFIVLHLFYCFLRRFSSLSFPILLSSRLLSSFASLSSYPPPPSLPFPSPPLPSRPLSLSDAVSLFFSFSFHTFFLLPPFLAFFQLPREEPAGRLLPMFSPTQA